MIQPQDLHHNGWYILNDGTLFRDEYFRYNITSYVQPKLEYLSPIPLTVELCNQIKLDSQWMFLSDGYLAYRQNDPSDFVYIPCEYLHQLQILVYTLTGEELELQDLKHEYTKAN